MRQVEDPGSTRIRGPGDPRLTAIGLVVIGAFIAAAIAKPWGSSAPLSVPPASSASSVPSATLTPVSPTDGSGLSQRLVPTAADPLPIAFRTSAMLPAASAWTGLAWRRLATDDPLSLITSVVRSRAGSVAVGLMPSVPATPVWTSTDGQRWLPLLFGTPSTFWPAMAILEVADLPTGLVAIAEAAPHCGAGPCSITYVLPLVSWTSPDGRRWSPHLLPEEWFASPTGVAPLVAVGPRGVLVASKGAASQLALSADGVTWTMSPSGTLPPGFVLQDVAGTPRGYVAAGIWTPQPGRPVLATLLSADGRSWAPAPTPLEPAWPLVGDAGSVTIVSGAAGTTLVARGTQGTGDATLAGPEVWQSADGQRWQALPPGAFPSEQAGGDPTEAPGPAWTFIGDGARIVALGAGGAWASADGRAWTPLSESGTLPEPMATAAASLLPNGVLLSAGSVTWLGQAVGH